MFLLEEFPLPLIFFRFSFYVRRVILQFFFACHSSFWGRTWSLSSLIRVIANYYILYFIIILLVSNSHITLRIFSIQLFLGWGPGPSYKILGGRDPPAAYAPDPEGLSKSQKRDFRKRSADVSLQEGILYYVGSRRQRSVSRQVIADLETKRRVIR